MDEIIGTIAGDDTVLIILKEGLSHERFRSALVERCPEKFIQDGTIESFYKAVGLRMANFGLSMLYIR
jgi:hypothetical protein